MKILMVSIFAPHFFNWTEQLKDSGHEVYWLDVFDSNTHVEKIAFAGQITGWRYKWDYPGRYFLKRSAPRLTKLINKINQRDLKKVLDKNIQKIKPDVVHSFVMYLGTAPILEVMKKYPDLKWIYSSWGSDLYFYRHKEKTLSEMKKTFPKLDYMFSDCRRDSHLAVENGFSGEFLGIFPGGGGFRIAETDYLMKPISSRNKILIKGYQGLHGKCISVLKALIPLKENLANYSLVIFGACEEVKDFMRTSELSDWNNIELKGKVPHSEVMKLMGEALLYIGNSTSDGTPNTLLEAIVMGAFPIQSNPGGATEEWIEDGMNGWLIKDPENVKEIGRLLLASLFQKDRIIEGITYNLLKIKPRLEREVIRGQVLAKYSYIEQNLKNAERD